jgi:hypothetical protein
MTFLQHRLGGLGIVPEIGLGDLLFDASQFLALAIYIKDTP